jgi:hypothetical protein
MTHEVLRRLPDFYNVAPRLQASSHRGRDAAFHRNHGLVRRSSIETPTGTRDRLLRIQAAVGKIEQGLDLSPPMQPRTACNPPPGRVTIVWGERARRSCTGTQGGRTLVESEGGAQVLQREAATRDRNACAEIEEEALHRDAPDRRYSDHDPRTRPRHVSRRR